MKDVMVIDGATNLQQNESCEVQLQQDECSTGEKSWYQDISFEDAKSFIKTNIVMAARNFIAIGYYLKHIRDNELFREDGHMTIWEFAQAEYGISESTASRYMKMNTRFSKGGNSPIVDERYKDFDKSKLQEMLSLTDEQVEQVTPEMRVQDIRNLRAPKEIPYFELPGQLDLETDFPEILPEMVEQVSPAPQAFTLSVADMIGDEELEGPVQTVAISQQFEEIAVDSEVEGIENTECELSDLDIAKEQLEKEKRLLSNGFSYGLSREDINIRRIIARVAALANYVCELENIENPISKLEQPELPILRNNNQRKEWLDGFRDWPVWFEVKESNEIYYRYNLPDESSFVICEYRYWASWIEKYGYYGENPEKTGVRDYLLKPGFRYLHDCLTNRSALIEKLKGIQKK